jgi:DNA-binding PadR family transcriptional regulator
MSRIEREHRYYDRERMREHRHEERENYWEEWREERRRSHPGEGHHHGHAPSPQEVQAWRDYFFQFFGVWPEQHWIFGGRRFGPWQQGMDSFNPFVANLLSKGGGLLPLYVLHLVAQQPRYGNEIMDILATRTNGQWVSNPGAIYPLLTQLEEEGFIQGEWADPTRRTVRTYSITPSGNQELARLRGIVAPKIEETIQVLQVFLHDLREDHLGAEEPSDSDPEPKA